MQLDSDRAASLLDRLYRTAILITRDPHEAEDLVQDTYELILRRPRELRGDSALHYLRAAMRRRAVDRHRESRRRVPVVGLDAAPEFRSRAGEEPGRRAEQAEVLAIRARGSTCTRHGDRRTSVTWRRLHDAPMLVIVQLAQTLACASTPGAEADRARSLR
jgi:DNA-directed RNA polymerase specialized sigma24 family protein